MEDILAFLVVLILIGIFWRIIFIPALICGLGFVLWMGWLIFLHG